MKEFKSLEEQIELLKQRGLIIPDEERAKKYLLTAQKKRPVLPAPSAARSVLPARSRFVIPQFMARTRADYLFIISEFNQLCISKISKGADFYGYHYKKRQTKALQLQHLHR